MIKLGLVAFWAAWFWIVLLTNVLGGLKALGRLSPKWKFASANYEAVAKAIAVYRPPRRLAAWLFASVVLWQLAAALLFTWAAWSSVSSGTIDLAAAHRAFGCGIALWAAFMLADEITLKYEFERTHELLFIAQLASLMALHLL